MLGNLINKITEGNWAVKEIINVDEQNGTIYFGGSVHYSSEKHLLKINLDGTDLLQLTKTEGTHKTEISPHGAYFYSNYSNINNPAKLKLFNGDGESIRLIADRRTELFDEYDLGTSELFQFQQKTDLNYPQCGYSLRVLIRVKSPAYLFLHTEDRIPGCKDSFLHI